MAVFRIVPLGYVHIGPEILGKVMVLKEQPHPLFVEQVQGGKEQGILLNQGIMHMDDIGVCSPMGVSGVKYLCGKDRSVSGGRGTVSVIVQFLKLNMGIGKCIRFAAAGEDKNFVARFGEQPSLGTDDRRHPAPAQMIVNQRDTHSASNDLL
jgi:hypothetical protein